MAIWQDIYNNELAIPVTEKINDLGKMQTLFVNASIVAPSSAWTASTSDYYQEITLPFSLTNQYQKYLVSVVFYNMTYIKFLTESYTVTVTDSPVSKLTIRCKYKPNTNINIVGFLVKPEV